MEPQNSQPHNRRCGDPQVEEETDSRSRNVLQSLVTIVTSGLLGLFFNHLELNTLALLGAIVAFVAIFFLLWSIWRLDHALRDEVKEVSKTKEDSPA